MAYLPTTDLGTLATRSDLAVLRSDLTLLVDRVSDVEQAVIRLDGRMTQRLDRLFLTLVAGLFVIVAAMAGVVAASLG